MVRIRYVVQRPCIMNLFDRILKRFDKSARGLLGAKQSFATSKPSFLPTKQSFAPSKP